jgi:hypothetical protein
VFRGISRGKLPREFWKPNKFKVRGGIEYAFMSCTRDPEVSKSYATAQPTYGPGMLLEIHMGMVARGADVAWISQYPCRRRDSNSHSPDDRARAAC